MKVNNVEIDAECITLVVPENRQNPDSRQIELPVMRIPATGAATAEPIFHLAGGPGMSNMDFRPPAALLENHDVVLVGYRGVDGSVRLDCPEMAQASKGDKNDLFSQASQTAMADAITGCGQRLRQAGIDLDGYTPLAVAEDIEAAREALGYERIHLLSESYATRVAQLYAQLQPNRVFRSVMIGVNPPGRFVWEPEMIDQQLRLYADLCAGDEDCRQRTVDLTETMRQVFNTMPSRWLLFPINAGKVKAVTFALLFNRSTATQVFDAYLAAANGDYSGLALMSLAYDFVLPNMVVWGDFLAKAYSADFDPQRDYTTLANPDTVMGSPISQLVWPVARGWPMARMPEAFRHVQPSAVETLLISGNLDFSTPVDYAAKELLPALENGQHLILSEMGHTSDFWQLQPDAAAHLLRTYFDTGQADEASYTDQPMRFKTGFFTFPRLAKIAIALPLGIFILLAGLAGRVWLKRRGH